MKYTKVVLSRLSCRDASRANTRNRQESFLTATVGIIVLVSAVLLLSSTAVSQETVISSVIKSFPNAYPGQLVRIDKLLNPVNGHVTIRLTSQGPGATAIGRNPWDEESKLLKARYGNLNGRLRRIAETMGIYDRVKVKIYLQTERPKVLNKMEASIDELRAASRASLQRGPTVSLPEITKRHGVTAEKVLGPNLFIAEVSVFDLKRMMFDNAIAAIEEYVEQRPTADYTFDTLWRSACNPPPLPWNAKGSRVHAATFENGVWQSHFDCLGNLDANNIEINNTRDPYCTDDDCIMMHSQQTFNFLWRAAPSATFYHHRAQNAWLEPDYDSQDSQDFLINNEIETVSLSYERGSDPNDMEFLVMDNFAYQFPFTNFFNPSSNSGYDLVVEWAPYNAVSVGNVRHTAERHYEMAGCTQAKNPNPVYGGCVDGGTPPDCAGDREMPYIVAPGISPDPAGGAGNWMQNPPCLQNDEPWAQRLYCGTSFSAPTANGIAADVISADARMRYWPEKVRVALLATAHNVDGGYWNSAIDGRDGEGVISGIDAIWFAKNRVEVQPGGQAETGSAVGTIDAASPTELQFFVKIPSVKPTGKHLRIVLTWDSNPDLTNHRNALSDLDLVFITKAGIYSSLSYDGNVESIDVPSEKLTAGAVYPLNVVVSRLDIPTDAIAQFFYYAVGWTWARDHAEFDPNLDGCVDTKDYDAIMRVVNGIDPYNASFDLNGDGKVDQADATKLTTMYSRPGGAPCN